MKSFPKDLGVDPVLVPFYIDSVVAQKQERRDAGLDSETLLDDVALGHEFSLGQTVGDGHVDELHEDVRRGFGSGRGSRGLGGSRSCLGHGSRRRLGGSYSEDSVSYGINVEKLTAPVYVKEVSDGEYRLQISGISGDRVNIEAFRYYNDGREPEYGGKTGVPLNWDVKSDPMTGNPIASDRVGGSAYLFSVPSEFQVILGPDSVEVLWNEEPMQPKADVQLAPEGRGKNFPDDVETIDG